MSVAPNLQNAAAGPTPDFMLLLDLAGHRASGEGRLPWAQTQ